MSLPELAAIAAFLDDYRAVCAELGIEPLPPGVLAAFIEPTFPWLALQ